MIDWDEVSAWHDDRELYESLPQWSEVERWRWPLVSHHAVIGQAPYHHEGDAGSGEPVFIHSEARIDALSVVAAGHKRPTLIGKAFIGSQVHVGHDSAVGDGCSIHAGVVIGGFVVIGEGTKVGLGSTIRPHRTIGRDVYIGMGSVVVSDVPDGEVWFGNPARKRGDRCPTCHQILGSALCKRLDGGG